MTATIKTIAFNLPIARSNFVQGDNKWDDKMFLAQTGAKAF